VFKENTEPGPAFLSNKNVRSMNN